MNQTASRWQMIFTDSSFSALRPAIGVVDRSSRDLHGGRRVWVGWIRTPLESNKGKCATLPSDRTLSPSAQLSPS